MMRTLSAARFARYFEQLEEWNMLFPLITWDAVYPMKEDEI